MPTMLKPILILTALLLVATAAHAQDTKMYTSPDRAHCEEELLKDRAWHDDLESQLYDNVHQKESDTFTRNNRHVVLAYAAIWVLTAGFVVFMFLRQQKLKVELARLTAELANATKDEA